MVSTPISTPAGRTRTAPRSDTQRAAAVTPAAIPMITTPIMKSDRCIGSPSTREPHSSTMNCSVAAAPQDSVVAARVIWPSRSRHSKARQCTNSRNRYMGLRLGVR